MRNVTIMYCSARLKCEIYFNPFFKSHALAEIKNQYILVFTEGFHFQFFRSDFYGQIPFWGFNSGASGPRPLELVTPV